MKIVTIKYVVETQEEADAIRYESSKHGNLYESEVVDIESYEEFLQRRRVQEEGDETD